MSLEDATNPLGEVAAAEEEVVIDQPEADGEEAESELDEVEFDEVEYEGSRYSVPKPLKDAILRQADYTQKTQEVAAQRKAIEEEKTQWQKQQEFRTQELKSYARLTAIDEQLEAYQKLDWQAIEQQNVNQALALRREYDDLWKARQQLAGDLSQREHQRGLEEQQRFARLREETRSALQREIKNWSPELESKLHDYGKNLGFKDNELESTKYDARQAKILNKAYLYDQLMKKAAQEPKEQTPVKPTQTVRGKAKATSGYRPDMTDAEFNAWRRRSITKR